MRNGAILIAVAVCALTYLLVGCVGELVAIVPSVADQGVSSGADMAQPQEMGDGKVHFFPDIQADLDKLSCTTAGACHGGTQAPMWKAAPTSQTDKDNNYQNFIGECNTTTPTMSLVIQKSTGAVSHTGGALLKTTDPAYMRWINWIGDGELK
jgi:hypothetical protein